MQVSKELYPFEGHFLDVGGARLHYLDEGRGDPVVMVHGNPSWSFYYRRLVTRLRDRYRVIVPDHVGCGLSDKPGDEAYDYTLSRRVDDLEKLLAHAGVTKNVTLVLHDWGGMIGMAWASRHPEMVKRLVLLNTAAFGLPAAKPLPWQLRLVRDTPVGSLLVRGFNAFSRGAARTGCTRNPMSKALRDAYCAPYDSWKNRIATLRFVQDIPLAKTDRGWDIVNGVETKLAQFRAIPTLICWGLKDFVFDAHFLAEWEKHLPQAEIHRFADCGHYILEDASDEVVPLIDAFLAHHPIQAAAA